MPRKSEIFHHKLSYIFRCFPTLENAKKVKIFSLGALRREINRGKGQKTSLSFDHFPRKSTKKGRGFTEKKRTLFTWFFAIF